MPEIRSGQGEAAGRCLMSLAERAADETGVGLGGGVAAAGAGGAD